MSTEDRDELEREIRRRFEGGDLRGAAAEAMRGYGPEIFGFLLALHRNEDEAAEVFSTFSEQLWRGLPGFAWQCSFRTWAYTVARNASHRHLRGARRRAALVPIADCPELSEIAERVRTETAEFLRTPVKDAVRALRDALPDADRTLLVLRVDRGMSWLDLARVFGDEPEDDAALKRAAARLRKRFQLLKERLLDEARRAGVTAGGDEGGP